MSSTSSRTQRGDQVPRAGAARAAAGQPAQNVNPWNALWAMMLGFFVILVDSTIVAVANPSIMASLGIGYDTVMWVTSAYLLGYAVPLLVAGRLGDQFGPKYLYLVGLTVFTLASLWCGLSGSIAMLITARAVQGVGAALLTPQTLSVITRTFPPDRRGVAMSIWGATAGVATLVGPLAGGVLVDRLGWEWIFFINIPIGVVGLVLAIVLMPELPLHRHRFDLIGVALSGVGMFLVVFALQEGESQGWAPWIWALIGGGLACLAAFVYWQAVTPSEPLVPLHIFRDLDFGVANVGVAVIGFAVTAMVLPVMFYAQAVCGMSPTRSALLTAPMAIVSGALAPIVGRIVDRAHPRTVVGFGFSMLAIALTWLSIEMTPTTPLWRLLLPFAAVGVGMAFIWSPLAATATRNLPPHLAGAGSGVYNATRQVGAVLGSAGMAAFMTSRIAADLPPMPGGGSPENASAVLQLPYFLHEPFALAMSESTLLPAFVALFGVVAALFMVGIVIVPARRSAGPRGDGVGRFVGFEDFDEDGFENDYDGDYDGDSDGDSDVGGARNQPDATPFPAPKRVSMPSHFTLLNPARGVDAPTAPIPAAGPSGQDRRRQLRVDPRSQIRSAPRVVPRPAALPEGRRYAEPTTEPLTVEIVPLWRPPADADRSDLGRNGATVAGGHFPSVPIGAPVADVLAKFGITGNNPARRNRHYREDAE